MKIHTLDLNYQNRPNTIAAYLVVGAEEVALVETGPASTLPALRQRLADHGYAPGDVPHVLVTHIHLDHAGAAGWWARQGAMVYVHHVGAPHLIDPSRLLSSASRIYGDQMSVLWGETLSAPAEQVVALEDGAVVEIGDLAFTALDTPGHAYHHHVFCLRNVAFVGDAAGVHIPGTPFVNLPAPPPEFHLEKWLQTVDRLLALPLVAIYPTHFGRIDHWHHHMETFADLLKETSDFVRLRMQAGLSRNELVTEYQEWVQERASAINMPAELLDRYEVANPSYMSVDGIMRYWHKRLQQ